jgi:hypothetical protein
MVRPGLQDLRAPKATPEQLDLLVQLVRLALPVPMVPMALLALPAQPALPVPLVLPEQLALTAQMAAEDLESSH